MTSKKSLLQCVIYPATELMSTYKTFEETKILSDKIDQKSAACHSAVKANDPLNETTARALLKSLAKCQRPDVCPHGRPTVLKMQKSELARRFGRI